MEEDPGQEPEPAKSDAGKIRLEVVLGAGREEGRQALDGVEHMADIWSTLLMGPHLTSSVWTPKAPVSSSVSLPKGFLFL